MKKLVALILVVCLAFTGLVAYMDKNKEEAIEAPAVENAEEIEAPAVEEENAPEATKEPVKMLSPDFEAIYALYEPEKVVMTVGGKDVTWGEYFYMLYVNAQEVISELNYYNTYYGMNISWSDLRSEETYAQAVISNVEPLVIQIKTIMGVAEENAVELTQEQLDSISARTESDMLAICGEGATDEDFNEYLASIYMPRALYDEINLVNLYYQENFYHLYGENCENISEEEAMQYIADNGYMYADHILFKTVDDSYQPLDETTVAEKKANAEAAAAEIAAIEDEAQRIEKFYELKDKYTEDGGAAVYPEGYTFGPGEMVAAFEEGHNSLADNEISGIVESEYGYHIILRKPLTADTVIKYTEQGGALSARNIIANNKYGEVLQAYNDSLEVVYSEDFIVPDILDYLV